MRSALFFAALFVLTAPVQAASLGQLLPRVQLSSMFEVERNSAGGAGGSRFAADGKAGGAHREAPVEAGETDTGTTEPVDPAVAPEPLRGGPMDPPKPRWKSMMPGALK